MTRGSIREYTEAVRGRYLRASKKEKGKVLDEFTEVVGCHRKADIHLLHRTNQVRVNGKGGCPWTTLTRLSSARIAAQVSLLVQTSSRYSRPGALPMSPSIVLNAERPGSNSAMEIDTAINREGKCILLYVPIVAKKRRYLSSPDRIDRCTAANATPE